MGLGSGLCGILYERINRDVKGRNRASWRTCGYHFLFEGRDREGWVEEVGVYVGMAIMWQSPIKSLMGMISMLEYVKRQENASA